MTRVCLQTPGTLPCGLHPGPGDEGPSVPTVQICLLGLLEGRKHLLEALRAQAGERLEHAAVAGNFGVADHWGFLCWLCLPSVAQVVLLPIGSNQ